MDEKLLTWARAVKVRQGRVGRAACPVLWLFTDARRLAEPLAAIRRLPRGLGGVVLRDAAGRPDRAAQVARLCRARRLGLSVGGDWRLAASLGAGVHLRDGRRPAGMPRWLPALTSSAHDVAGLLRARRAWVALAFLSPAFTTASHPGATPLGLLRWARAARAGGGAAALGGVDGTTVRRVPAAPCRGAGAISALL